MGSTQFERKAYLPLALRVKKETASLEYLPALEVRPLRELDLDAPSAPGRPAHLSAASGVVRRGDFVYAIGDDELSIGVFRLGLRAGEKEGAAA